MINKLLDRLAASASLYTLTGKRSDYNKVQYLQAEIIQLKEKSESEDFKVVKYRNGRPTVIDWNGERWVFEPTTAFKGGVQHGNGKIPKHTRKGETI